MCLFTCSVAYFCGKSVVGDRYDHHLLSGSPYRAELGENANFILKHSTINMNKGNYDTVVVYADYYYVEALMRYKKYLQSL